MRALQEQMHISLFGEAVHLLGIDCLHGAAQVCCPCRPNISKNRPTEQWLLHCPVATKKLVLYDKRPNLFPINTEPTNTLGVLNYLDLEKILGQYLGTLA